MSYKNLSEFIEKLDREGELCRVKTEVSRDLEITEIADRAAKSAGGGKALLFENVSGSKYPVLINAFASYRRLELALGKIDDLLKFDISDLTGLFKSAVTASRVLSSPPSRVGNAPCQQIIEEPDLDALPVLRCWPRDAGRFFTLPLVFTRDPETGAQNVGMYRMQVFDKTTAGMHWHLHKDGRAMYRKHRERGIRKMPVSVALGGDPATIYAATAPLPPMIDELMFAGYMRRRPVPVVKSTLSDIYVPAEAEFVIEGWVDTDELRVEGPFGDHTGYYSEPGKYPVFHAERVTRRENPVFPATVVGRPPMEDCYLAKATERIFLPLLKMIAPEIVDMNFPLEGVFHNCVIVSINKRYPAHAKKVMNTVWGMGQMMYTKLVIVVDADVDPHDVQKVAWKAFNNIDARRDLVISEGPLDALDHASPDLHMGARLGLDATRKFEQENGGRVWPPDIEMSEEIKNLVDKKWRDYGIK